MKMSVEGFNLATGIDNIKITGLVNKSFENQIACNQTESLNENESKENISLHSFNMENTQFENNYLTLTKTEIKKLE